MKTKARLVIFCGGRDTSSALASVLSPDNEGVPKGLKVSVHTINLRVLVEIESESSLTAISTTLGVLRDVSLFGRIWLLSRPR